MKTVIVRQAVLSDVDNLAPLFDGYRQFYGFSGNVDAARQFLLDRFNHGESTLFIAQEEETAIGFAQLYPSFSSALLGRTFIVNDLFVDERYRRKGAATQLLSAATEFAKQLGAVRLSLSTRIDNKQAQALYESAGWNRDEQFITYHYTNGVIASGGAQASRKS